MPSSTRPTRPTIVAAPIVDRGEYLAVEPVWSAPGITLDRPVVGGISVGHDRRLGERLAAAYLAGVATEPGEVRSDVNGRTYVEAASRVMGRYLNADLTRLGF